MEKSYSEVEKEYGKIKRKIAETENKCAEKGMSFEDMIEETSDDRNKLFDLAKELRLLKEPVVEFGKSWKGTMYSLEEFVVLCENGTFTDNDGYGYYATETAKSNVEIYPSDVTEDKYRNDFTHVLWLGDIK